MIACQIFLPKRRMQSAKDSLSKFIVLQAIDCYSMLPCCCPPDGTTVHCDSQNMPPFSLKAPAPAAAERVRAAAQVAQGAGGREGTRQTSVRRAQEEARAVRGPPLLPAAQRICRNGLLIGSVMVPLVYLWPASNGGFQRQQCAA